MKSLQDCLPASDGSRLRIGTVVMENDTAFDVRKYLDVGERQFPITVELRPTNL
jgi:hypothetical protein